MIHWAHLSRQPAVFAQMTAKCPYTLQWDAPSPTLKTAPSHWGSGPPSTTWFPEPTRVLNPNSISIGSAVFAGLTSVTDRQTALLVSNNRPHSASTYVVRAMRSSDVVRNSQWRGLELRRCTSVPASAPCPSLFPSVTPIPSLPIAFPMLISVPLPPLPS